MSVYSSVRMVPQPKRLNIRLFDHQLASIYQMEKLEREQVVDRELVPTENRCTTMRTETRLGINSDPTGYGKTLSMIGLILRDKMLWDMDTPFTFEKITTESAGLIRSRVVSRYNKLPATMILVTPSILIQWQSELHRTNLIVSTVATKKDVDNIDATESDVVLVTINMYNYLVRSYSRYAWKRLIFDEPGHSRVPGMKDVRAGFYWFVTATPNAITTKHRNCRGSFIKKIIGDNWCEFEEQFGDLIVRNNEDFVRSSFVMPISENYYYSCFQPLSNTINGLVPLNITTMIEAGNIEGAITALGGSKTNNIMDLVRKKKLEELEKAEHKIRLYTIREDKEQINIWISKQTHIQTQLSELKIRFKGMLEGSCLICREELKQPVLEPSCQHLFCGECLLTWLKRRKTCPTCRINIKLSDLIYVKTKNDDTHTNNNCKNVLPKTKIEKIVDIIRANKNGKFLVFSAYDATFEPICRVLKENKIKYKLLKGSVTTRQNSINGFKKGNIQVIFLNSNFNGAGINLQETTDLILYHKMSEVTRRQIIGRAERIGRKEPLRIHHLQVYI